MKVKYLLPTSYMLILQDISHMQSQNIERSKMSTFTSNLNIFLTYNLILILTTLI